MGDVPRFLFIPVSGPGGAGEYFRSLAVARGIERRWPDASIKFVLSRDASYAAGAPYPVLPVDRSPTYETAAVMRILEQERPDVAIFDSSGRVAQYRAARRVGANVVFVSSRPTTRRKGFRLRRMRSFAQHWIAQPRYLGGELSSRERLLLKFAPRLEVLFLEVVHEPIDAAATRELQSRLDVQPSRYVLACPGGGGDFGRGPDAAEVFLSAAARVTEATSVPVVAVLGARFGAPAAPAPGVRVVPTLPNAQLVGMARDAAVAIVNGGSLLLQSMAQLAPCVAVPISEDQPQRIAATVRHGYARSATLDPGFIATEAISLLRDETQRTALRTHLATLGLTNGVDVAVAAIGRLVPDRG